MSATERAHTAGTYHDKLLVEQENERLRARVKELEEREALRDAQHWGAPMTDSTSAPRITHIEHADPGDEQPNIDGAWRCECCGEMASVNDTSFRWAGDRWQHRHPEAQTTFDCRYFGPKIGDESEAAMTDERAAVERFSIRYEPDYGYKVSIPRYDGGEVVRASDYDALRAENERLRAENTSLKEANEIDPGEKAPLIFENTALSARVSELTRLLAEAEENLKMSSAQVRAAERTIRALQSGEGE